MRKLFAVTALAVGLVIGLPATSSAGGWTVVSLDSVPVVHPGEDTEIGFTVLRHGVTPESWHDLEVVVNGQGGTFRFPARQHGAVGHHVATVRLPDAGDYRWQVTGPFVAADLGTLRATQPGPSWTWSAVQWGSGSLALVLAAAAAVDVRRSRRHRVVAATVA